jgi:hypothetical protein
MLLLFLFPFCTFLKNSISPFILVTISLHFPLKAICPTHSAPFAFHSSPSQGVFMEFLCVAFLQTQHNMREVVRKLKERRRRKKGSGGIIWEVARSK